MDAQRQNQGAGASIVSATGLTLLGTTCCALPIALIALGAGGAVASLVSAAPWLVALSQYKLVTFGITALALGFSWRQVRRVMVCDIADAKRLRWQRWVLWGATGLFVVSVFSAYAMLPLALWLEG